MKINMGNPDRAIRVIVAVILGTLSFMGILTGALGIAALIVALIFLLTSFIGFCPLYRLFGFSSTRKK